MALVIGVSNYQSFRKLDNPAKDATMVGGALERLGFNVHLLIDPTRDEMIRALLLFQSNAENAKAAIIYYAGHGVEIDGVNYLIPRDFSMPTNLSRSAAVAAVTTNALATAQFREAILGADTVRLVVLDACRDDPTSQLKRSMAAAGGLAREAGGSTSKVVTLMAASPGHVALDAAVDGDVSHGPFARAFVKALQNRSMTVGELPGFVQTEVQRLTDDGQVPDLQGIWVDVNWSFDPNGGATSLSPGSSAAARAGQEAVFWQTIENSTDAADFKAYLDAANRGDLPGLYRGLALNRLWAIQKRPVDPLSGRLRPKLPQVPVKSVGGLDKDESVAMTGAFAARQRGDFPEAAHLWARAAQMGNRVAMFNLGVLSYTGQGLAKDSRVAAQWFRAAAEAGHPGGMVNYGLCLLNGYGVAKDEGAARVWLRRAAEQGLPKAMTLVGLIYRDGLGVARDSATAADWMRRASENGDNDATAELAQFYENGVGVVASPQRAFELYRKAADAGDTASMVRLGYYYEDGDVAPQDLVQAATWYQRAAERGDAEGMSSLGVMLENGRGVEQNLAAAADDYRQAAARGDVRGMLGLGDMLATGKGVDQDETAALRLFQKAAEAGSASAMLNAGIMYEQGRGAPRDRMRAIVYYRRAEKAGEGAAAQALERLGENQ